ncbi:MAG TPA: hypothetical protein VJT73_09805, partial [Polyangiaceae bacterium]|nr:hypothetical protein [Polyangiaceae bacterium]
PKRDLSFVEGPIDQLDHGANQALYGSKVCIDATRKWAEEGYRREWPEVCRFPSGVAERALLLAKELGIGGELDKVQAPSGKVAQAASRLRDVLERIANAAEKSG